LLRRTPPRWLGQVFNERLWAPRLGRVALGDLDRDRPLGGVFGWHRGTPIDRHYIEAFLAANRAEIRGEVLEVCEDIYTRRFGGQRVSGSHVVDIDPTNPRATIIADLEVAGSLPERAYDCIILTQTLLLIGDLGGALANLHSALKPGGTLLLTCPGITPVDPAYIRTCWWTFTRAGLAGLLEKAFFRRVEVGLYGNMRAAVAFLAGLSVADLDPAALTPVDECYPVTLAACVRKADPA
jgi:SAM-dependent methyltransferase